MAIITNTLRRAIASVTEFFNQPVEAPRVHLGPGRH